MQRKSYPADFKAKVSLEAIRESRTMAEPGFCIDALEEALVNRQPEVFNSDQGSQFTSDVFICVSVVAGYASAWMVAEGQWINIMVERLWRSVRYEEVYLKDYQRVKDAFTGLAHYFHFYNTERPHQSLGYQTPASVGFPDEDSQTHQRINPRMPMTMR